MFFASASEGDVPPKVTTAAAAPVRSTRSAREAIAALGWGLGTFLRTGRWVGQSVALFDHDARYTDMNEGAIELRRSTSQGGVSFRNSGLVFGPRLLIANVGVDLSLRHEAFADGSRSSSGTGKVVGYDFGLTAWPDRRLSFGLSAARSRTVLPRLFGSAREQLVVSRGGQIRLAAPVLDSTLRWTSVRLESDASTDRDRQRDGEERTTLEYTGTRRTDRQSLTVEHRREDREDLVFPDLSFPFHLTRLRHSIVLDTDVDQRTLLTSFSLNHRGGSLQRDQLRAETRLDFRIRPTLDTRIAYRLEKVEAVSLNRDRQTVDLRAQHRLYESLVSTIGVKNSRETLDAGDRRLLGANLLLEYRKRLPAGGRLSTTIGRQWDREDNRFGDREDIVLGEIHEARLAAPFRLERPQVVLDSIVITDASGTIPFRVGFDYDVNAIGEIVEISILPAGQIVDGQTLLVDYRFAVLPFTKTRVTQTRFDVSIDYGWINPYYRSSDAGRGHLEGFDDGSLFHRTSRAEGVAFRFGKNDLRVYLRNERLTEKSRNLDFESLVFDQTVSYSFRPGFVLTTNANEIVTHFRVPERRESRGSINADLWWRVTPLLSLRAMGASRWRHDELGFDERINQLGFDARWTRSTFGLSTGITRDWGVRDGRRSTGLRLTMSLSRPF